MNLRTRVKREEAKITAWKNLQKPKAKALLGNIAGSNTLFAVIPKKTTFVNLESLSYSSPHENWSSQKDLVKREEAKIIAWENLQKSKAKALFRNMRCRDGKGWDSNEVDRRLNYDAHLDLNNEKYKMSESCFKISGDALDRTEYESIDPKVAMLIA
ncbi:hypothetical protein Tco_1099712 [Tanacetum coccineum]